MKTFAFKNSQKYWSTRYSFSPRNYSRLDRDMFTSHPTGSDAMYIHGPKASAEKNTFYGTKFSSSISFTFNNDPSQNKIYKNISVEGSFGPSATPSLFGTFKANDSTDPTQARPSSINEWNEKGAHLHATIANSPKSGRSNIEPVGVFRRAHQIFYPTDATAPGLGELFDMPPLTYGSDGYNGPAGPYMFPMGLLAARDVVPGGTFTNVDPEWAVYDRSRYLFFEIDFFPGYKDSSKEVKYVLDTSDGEYIQSIQGSNYDSIQSVYLSNKGLCQYAKNKGVLDFRKKTVINGEEGFEFDETSGLSVNGAKSASGLLVYADIELTEGVTLDFGDFDDSGAITVADLLLFLTAFGSDYESEDDPLADFDFDEDGAIATSDLLEFLARYGLIGEEPVSVPSHVFALNSVEGVLNKEIIVYAVTPTNLNGEAARGNYADVSLTFPGANFELDIVNLDYEPTQLDHSR